MVDLFTLALTHGLMLLALWRLLFREDLDAEGDEPGRAPAWRKPRAAGSEAENADA